MKKRLAMLILTVLLLAAVSISAVGATNYDATYRITIYNLTTGQPWTPPAVVVHEGRINWFQRGQAASLGIKEIAENGNLAPFIAAAEADSRVSDVIVAVSAAQPPLLPRQSVSVEFTGTPGHDFVSLVTMLICTNDGFTGVNSLRLPQRIGGVSHAVGRAYDAGTEINTEDFADIVPPCPALTGVDSSDAGSGVSNPALAQNGVVRFHRNIQGIADLIPSVHAWYEPVLLVTVQRIR
jgi:hypothetical protein